MRLAKIIQSLLAQPLQGFGHPATPPGSQLCAGLLRLYRSLCDLTQESENGLRILRQLINVDPSEQAPLVALYNARLSALFNKISDVYDNLADLRPSLYSLSPDFFVQLTVALSRKGLMLAGCDFNYYVEPSELNCKKYDSIWLQALLTITRDSSGNFVFGAELSRLLEEASRTGKSDHLDEYDEDLNRLVGTPQWLREYSALQYPIRCGTDPQGTRFVAERDAALQDLCMVREQMGLLLNRILVEGNQAPLKANEELSKDLASEVERLALQRIVIHYNFSWVTSHLDVRGAMCEHVSSSHRNLGSALVDRSRELAIILEKWKYSDGTNCYRRLIHAGKAFFADLITKELADCIDRATTVAASNDYPVTFSMRATSDSDHAPWELGHDGSEFLCLRYALYRYPSVTHVVPRERLNPRIRKVLLIAASPFGQRNLPSSDLEVQAISTILGASGISSVVVSSKKASLENVLDALASPDYQALHFVGHGFGLTADNDPFLVVGTEQTGAQRLDAHSIV